MTKYGNAKRKRRGGRTDALRTAEERRVSSRRAEKTGARDAEKVFRPFIRELFGVLPLRSMRAEIVSMPSDDDTFDVSGVKFFADPLTNAEFEDFAAKSPWWKDFPVTRDEKLKGRACVSDYCGDFGGALFNAFALDGSGGDAAEEAMSGAYKEFKKKSGPGADRCLKELDLYAFAAERTCGGSVSFKVFGLNPNALASVVAMRRKKRANPCR